MTCIVGLEHPHGVTIGGDSAGIEDGAMNLTIRRDPKVFTRGPFLIGYTSSFRMGQVLRYRLTAAPQEHQRPEIDDFEYMATVFIDAVRACLSAAGVAKKEHEIESGGSFLIGYHGKLYEIDSDYQVAIPEDGYAAVGCGAPVAHGSLHSTRGFFLDAHARTVRALEAAERHCAGVRAPFRVETQLAVGVTVELAAAEAP